MSIIKTINLTKRFERTVAVDNLSLEIEKGEIFGFLGPNGAGKSTTIRMLCGILEPTSGQGWVGGYDIIKEAEKIKTIIGYMSQSFGLYQDLTVEENLRFYSRLYISDKALVKKRVEEIIELMDLSPYRRFLAGRLSGGWKQRLALACAVVHRPQIIFLDEPTAGIDPVSRRILWDYLYELSTQGITLFVTTHYMEEAERCHRIGFIWEGKLVACDTPDGIKKYFGKDRIVSLRCRDINKAFKMLKKEKWIKDMNLYGDEIHLVVEENGNILDQIREVLSFYGLKEEGLSFILPSIEDVFVSLSKKANMDDS